VTPGFCGLHGLEARSSRALLLSYVDSTVLRDMIERHNIRTPWRCSGWCDSCLPMRGERSV